MKQIYTLIIALVSAATVTSAPVITVIKNNGNWNSSSTWDLGRKPQDGDTIVVPINYVVALKNSQNLNNVYIRIVGKLELDKGKLNLNTNSKIRVYGQIFGHGQGNGEEIKIGNVFKFNDNISNSMVAGPVYADNTTAASPNGFSMFSALPVSFTSFSVSRMSENVRVSWSTATESNNHHFEVERSFDGSNWSSIAIVQPEGNEGRAASYSYTDKKMTAPVCYYRIKQVDKDGGASFTAIRAFKSTETNRATKIFTTTNKNISIQFDQVRSNVLVRIFTLNGQPVLVEGYRDSALISLKLNNAVPGIYVVQVTDETNKTETKKIIL